MRVINITEYSNINSTEESIDLKTSSGNSIRVFFDKETKKLRIISDYEILAESSQTSDLIPYVSISGFNYPCD
jgi:hypothetical protein